MELFFRLFEPGIPWSVAACVILIASIVTCIVIRMYYEKRRQKVLMIWIVAYVFLMLYSTVLGRLDSIGKLNDSNVRLMPFWSIQYFNAPRYTVLYEKVYNILFFIPYGVLLGLRDWKSLRNLRGAIVIGFLTSVTIELLQLITRTGTCETDDVICNTVGCAVGTLIGAGICRMIGMIRNR